MKSRISWLLRHISLTCASTSVGHKYFSDERFDLLSAELTGSDGVNGVARDLALDLGVDSACREVDSVLSSSSVSPASSSSLSPSSPSVTASCSCSVSRSIVSSADYTGQHVVLRALCVEIIQLLSEYLRAKSCKALGYRLLENLSDTVFTQFRRNKATILAF